MPPVKLEVGSLRVLEKKFKLNAGTKHQQEEDNVKRLIALFTIVLILGFTTGAAMSANGPAPNSGDGISDGSGMDTQNGPNSDSGDAPGPAENSGDGVSDGSGMDSPNNSQ